jgi:integrase
VSRPGNPGAAEPGQHRAPAGLLEKLMAAVRPEFRGEVIPVDPSDPVFGGPPCQVPGCSRTARVRGICLGHYHRWKHEGCPPAGDFTATTDPALRGHRPLQSCDVPGCGYGRRGEGLCTGHHTAWLQAGGPALPAWLGTLPAEPADGPAAPCLVSYCDLMAEGGTPFCLSHGARWRRAGKPDPGEFTAACDDHLPGCERLDFRRLSGQLRLEAQYAVQRRRDEARLRTPPRHVSQFIGALARSGVTSLLDWPEQQWRQFPPLTGPSASQARALAVQARREAENLCYGTGWDVEYPRDTWRLRNLGITAPHAYVRFGGIPQDWLRELAKRHARWQLTAGLSSGEVTSGARAVTRLGVFLDSAGITSPSMVSREILERFLASLTSLPAAHRYAVTSKISTFLQDVRLHGWEETLPAGAMIFREDYPPKPARLPRALAEHIMAQVEDPANLSRCADPAVRLVTVILMRCGLRSGDALKLPREGCIARDPDGAPYLRYYNHKMKREALVPVDDELETMIGEQQQRVLARWPGGSCPHLFPSLKANASGQRSFPSGTYRDMLYRWLEDCDVRDEHGRPVHLTPHQWRHTLGTRLINRDVPQHVVQKILDHDSAEMVAHYARLSDKTVREHWEKARKVNAEGQPVQVSPDGPLGDAAWAKQRLSRATQALPNGYCELPMVKTCPHANSCLTCPMFVTTAEFLPQHHAQRKQTLQIITAAEANGQARVAEMNRQVAGNLDKIITALETSSRDGGEAAASAS